MMYFHETRKTKNINDIVVNLIRTKTRFIELVKSEIEIKIYSNIYILDVFGIV